LEKNEKLGEKEEEKKNDDDDMEGIPNEY